MLHAICWLDNTTLHRLKHAS